MQATIPRVIATPAALDMIGQLRGQYGPLMFFQSGGCCDGSSPMCYAAGDFNISEADIYLGHLDGTPFYMFVVHFEASNHTHPLSLLVALAVGPLMFFLSGGVAHRRT